MITLSPIALINNNAAHDLLLCNDFTAKQGLALTFAQARELIETKYTALKNTGRIEIEGGAIHKIITIFHDSAYIDAANYAAVLHCLVETFYYFKNETFEAVSDDELIQTMKSFFEESCNGSLELLQGRELEKFSAKIREELCR
jgi:hypothetical protein